MLIDDEQVTFSQGHSMILPSRILKGLYSNAFLISESTKAPEKCTFSVFPIAKPMGPNLPLQ